MKLKREIVLLILISLVGLMLRLYKINSVSLYGDELTLVYDAYSLLQTGTDSTGASFPLTFSMGAGRPAGYVYATIPFVALFGPTPLGVRSLSILSGIGAILLIFYLGKYLVDTRVGLTAALLLAISPWDLSLSRGGFEAHFALFLILLGIVCFLYCQRNPKLLLISALSFGLTIHTYPTYKVIMPLLLPLLFFYTRAHRWIFRQKFVYLTLLSSLAIASLIVIAIFQTFFHNSEARFSNINVFTQGKIREEIIQKVNYERSLSQVPFLSRPLFHNRFTEYGIVLLQAYLKNFSPDFLFLKGDGNPRHNMSTSGEFYTIELILIILGIAYLIKEKRSSLTFLALSLLIAPLPATFLLETHALRLSFMLPILILFSASGLVSLWNLAKSKHQNWLIWLVIASIFLQFILIAEKLYFLSPTQFGRFWSYPAKLASDLTMENKQRYKYIILSDSIDNIEYAYPVYARIDPRQVISQNQKRSTLKGLPLKKFDNVYIGYIPDGMIEEFVRKLDGSVLFLGAVSKKDFLKNYETVLGSDGTEVLSLEKVI